MSLNLLDPGLVQNNRDDSTVYSEAATPPESIDTFLGDRDTLNGTEPSSPFLVPWPGSTFIIRSVSSGKLLTLLDGQLVLAQPGSQGSIHWACIETKGWLGFRNVVSGRLLGHDAKGNLTCSASRQQGWENFCVRMRPEGGCVLLMTHYERLWHVGIKVEQGQDRLAKVGNEGGNDGIVWEFSKI
ncbi:MAG: hypothetical protein Q9214_000953 [Letrouitia sp. 1 TL-2023]